MQLKKLTLPAFLALLFFQVSLLYSQQANTLYFMRGVPQVYQVNPAFQPECKFFLGFPGLSPLHAKLENSPFAISDVLIYEESIDSLITFLHPLADTDAFFSILKDKNRINTDIGASLFSLGFRAKNAYLSFDISQRASVRTVIPDDLFRLPVYGPDSAMTYDFNHLGIHASVWSEYAMGISYNFGDKLSIGLRGKLLFGQANINTHKFDVTLSTGDNSWPVRSDIKLDVCAPFLDVSYDEEGMIDFDNLDARDMEIPGDLPSVILNPKNSGLAMDIGVDFRPLQWLQVSASLVDFGWINWNDYVYNLENNAEYDFMGVEVNMDSEDFMQDLADSLEQVFKFSAAENPYSTSLPAKVYAGVALYPHPRISFGALSRTEILDGDIRQQFTLSANFYPIRMLSTAFSYSIIDGYYKNLGIGLSFKPGPFNLYLITDTGPSAAFWPYEARFVNFRLGLNLMFGCKKPGKKEQKFDIPLIY